MRVRSLFTYTQTHRHSLCLFLIQSRFVYTKCARLNLLSTIISTLGIVRNDCVRSCVSQRWHWNNEQSYRKRQQMKLCIECNAPIRIYANANINKNTIHIRCDEHMCDCLSISIYAQLHKYTHTHSHSEWSKFLCCNHFYLIVFTNDSIFDSRTTNKIMCAMLSHFSSSK